MEGDCHSFLCSMMDDKWALSWSLTFGILDSIFHDPGTGILFANFKYVGYNWAGDMEKMRDNPKVQEWWKMTDSYQESLVEGAKSSVDGEPSWWKGVQEVFYFP